MDAAPLHPTAQGHSTALRKRQTQPHPREPILTQRVGFQGAPRPLVGVQGAKPHATEWLDEPVVSGAEGPRNGGFRQATQCTLNMQEVGFEPTDP